MKIKYFTGNIALWLMFISVLTSCMKRDNDFIEPNSAMFGSYVAEGCLDDFVQVSAGSEFFSLGLKEDGTVWGWGTGNYGVLGVPHNSPFVYSPIQINDLPNDIKAVYAGNYRSFAITSNGDVWAWGNNVSGSLGIGLPSGYIYTPTKVNITNVLSCNSDLSDHTLFLKNDGSVWACGNNNFGQLGIGSFGGGASAPVPSLLLGGVTSIATSLFISSAVKDGVVYTWGENRNNLFGDGSSTSSFRSVPTAINLTNIAKIDMGNEHALSLSNNGDVYSWGKNLYGQIGSGLTGNAYPTPYKVGIGEVKDIEASFANSWAVLSNGAIMAWGQNNHGVLGISPPTQNRSIPAMSTITQDAEYITTGYTHAIAKKRDGTYWATGLPRDWGVGSSATSAVSTFTKISCEKPEVLLSGGVNHMIYQDKDGNVWAIGDNFSGELGNGTTEMSNDRFTRVVGLRDLKAISTGRNHSLFLTKDGKVFACGSNALGMLGINLGNDYRITIPTEVPGLSNVVDIASGCSYLTSFNLALKSDGTVWAWGSNDYGQLGLGRTDVSSNIYVPPTQIQLSGKAIAIKAGDRWGCVLLEGGIVQSWGKNEYGELGLGVPTSVRYITGPLIIPLEGIEKLFKGNGAYTYVRKTDGTYWAWGYNWGGSIFGPGTTPGANIFPVKVSIPLETDLILDVVTGNDATMEIKADKTLWSWGIFGTPILGTGGDYSGSLKQVVGMNNIKTVSLAYSIATAVDNDNILWIWGSGWGNVPTKAPFSN
jgi:alpha-tubulin suppressor-like RCC1 family protein